MFGSLTFRGELSLESVFKCQLKDAVFVQLEQKIVRVVDQADVILACSTAFNGEAGGLPFSSLLETHHGVVAGGLGTAAAHLAQRARVKLRIGFLAVGDYAGGGGLAVVFDRFDDLIHEIGVVLITPVEFAQHIEEDDVGLVKVDLAAQPDLRGVFENVKGVGGMEGVRKEELGGPFGGEAKVVLHQLVNTSLPNTSRCVKLDKEDATRSGLEAKERLTIGDVAGQLERKEALFRLRLSVDTCDAAYREEGVDEPRFFVAGEVDVVCQGDGISNGGHCNKYSMKVGQYASCPTRGGGSTP